MCLHIPIMYNYSTWKAFEGERQAGLATQLTIGNMGQSQPRCAVIKLFGDKLPIGCNTGVITDFTHVGVYKYKSAAERKAVCSSGTGDATGLDCESISRADHGLFDQLQTACVGKQSCIVNDLHSYVQIGAQSRDSGCVLTQKDSLYVQYICKVPHEELRGKRDEAL